MRIRQASPNDLDWLEKRTGCVLTRSATGIAAHDKTGIRACVAYDNPTHFSVQAHMAADTPIAWRSLIPSVFEYPFEACGKGLLVAVIAGDNRKSLDLASRFGFVTVGILEDGWARGVPLVTLELRKENCRFLSAERKVA